MPFVQSQGARIHYHVTGDGDPIVLIMGLGWDMSGWNSLMDHLHGYKVLRIDNRGAGRSESPNVSYSIPMMARDVLAVMDDASVSTAHIYGASLGSMMAQEIALSYPERVRTLILGCPSPGVLSIPGSPKLLKVVRERNRMTSEEGRRMSAPFVVHREGSTEKLMELFSGFENLNPVGTKRQLAAVFRWSSLTRLPKLRIPTLVIHGVNDRLIPIANGRLIARLIKSSRLVEIPDCGHIYSIDAPDVSANAVVQFLRDTAGA